MHTKAHEKLFESCLLLLNWACVAEIYGAVGPPYTSLEQKKVCRPSCIVWKMVKKSCNEMC